MYLSVVWKEVKDKAKIGIVVITGRRGVKKIRKRANEIQRHCHPRFLKLNCKYKVMTVGAMDILFLHYIQI